MSVAELVGTLTGEGEEEEEGEKEGEGEGEDLPPKLVSSYFSSGPRVAGAVAVVGVVASVGLVVLRRRR